MTLVGADSVIFASLPTDGILSADDVGGTAPNSPRNFAGDTASIDGGSCPCVATGPFEESFDVYPPATSLHGLGDWKGIDNDPFFTAFTTTGAEPANSPPQSVDISSDSDLVHEYCAEGVGIVVLSAWQFIESPYVTPTGTELNVFNTYTDGGQKKESLSVRFDPSDGMAKFFHGDGSNTINVPYDPDRWVEIQAVVDLDDDWTRVYYDDTLITEYSWTGGILGDGGGAADIAAIDLFANGSSSVFYDDLRLEPLPDLKDDFDSYANGSDLQGQGGWKGFDGSPAGPAPASQDQARSAPQSADIAAAANLVHEAVTPLDGVYSLELWQYIPGSFSSAGSIEPEEGSILRVFSIYSDGGAKQESIELRADSSSGNLEVFQGAGSVTIDVPYVTDQWVKIQAIIDLDDDWTQVYYDDDLIAEYTWTGGILGGAGSNLDIAAVEMYANGADSVFYDDLVLDRGCGVGRTSDADGDGASIAQEFEEGTNPCVAESRLPALRPEGLALLMLALLAIGLAMERTRRVRLLRRSTR